MNLSHLGRFSNDYWKSSINDIQIYDQSQQAQTAEWTNQNS